MVYSKDLIRKESSFKQLFKALSNASKGSDTFADIAEDLLNFSKQKERRLEGFQIIEFVEQKKEIYARSTIYRVAKQMKTMGMLEYSGVTGMWRMSNELGNSGKRLYKWWKAYLNE